MKDLLGVLGGMGPLASQLFYKLLTERTDAERDQDHIPLLLLSDTEMPDRTSAILSGDTERVRERMRADLRFLEESGCRAVAVTCNTAHFFVDMVAPELHIPVLHMVRLAAEEAAARSAGERVAILATRGTIRTGLYQRELEARGVPVYLPPEKVQALVDLEIYQRIKRGRRADMAAWGAIEAAARAAGCALAILGCTELSCIRDQEGLGPYHLDPMEVLAERAIRFMGRPLRPKAEG